MAMNTPYLSMNTSAQSNVNSPYITTGVVNFSNTSSVGTMWVQDFVVRGSQSIAALVASSTFSSVATASLGPIVGASTLSMVGTSSLGSVTIGGPLYLGGSVASPTTIFATGARYFSRVTTVSGTSLVNQDGEISVTNLSTTSCTLQYRSGATTYTFRADAASVL